MSKKTWKSDLQKSFYPFFNWLDNVGKGKTLNERTRDIMLGTIFWVIVGYLIWSFLDQTIHTRLV